MVLAAYRGNPHQNITSEYILLFYEYFRLLQIIFKRIFLINLLYNKIRKTFMLGGEWGYTCRCVPRPEVDLSCHYSEFIYFVLWDTISAQGSGVQRLHQTNPSDSPLSVSHSETPLHLWCWGARAFAVCSPTSHLLRLQMGRRLIEVQIVYKHNYVRAII